MLAHPRSLLYVHNHIHNGIFRTARTIIPAFPLLRKGRPRIIVFSCCIQKVLCMIAHTQHFGFSGGAIRWNGQFQRRLQSENHQPGKKGGAVHPANEYNTKEDENI